VAVVRVADFVKASLQHTLKSSKDMIRLPIFRAGHSREHEPIHESTLLKRPSSLYEIQFPLRMSKRVSTSKDIAPRSLKTVSEQTRAASAHSTPPPPRGASHWSPANEKGGAARRVRGTGSDNGSQHNTLSTQDKNGEKTSIGQEHGILSYENDSMLANGSDGPDGAVHRGQADADTFLDNLSESLLGC
jgi:hypothetical protein